MHSNWDKETDDFEDWNLTSSSRRFVRNFESYAALFAPCGRMQTSKPITPTSNNPVPSSGTVETETA